ncbi:hypothetical protein AGR4C_pa60090 [Agrobacterium tumefaciens str. Kerr 14]|uniref:Uncharacterized protein n=1 Tax=Agrobacterium tumefaciens str. Kerr 14 TaxID=1183424 RepID=A0A1S7SC84_AGRTU|nr:hypothetical protein AGR4C_pa60090 [Agrobacterium tumefaciens str. Kerr 14]
MIRMRAYAILSEGKTLTVLSDGPS